MERKVTDLGQAVNMLGVDTVKTVVLVRGTLQVLRTLHPNGIDLGLRGQVASAPLYAFEQFSLGNYSRTNSVSNSSNFKAPVSPASSSRLIASKKSFNFKSGAVSSSFLIF